MKNKILSCLMTLIIVLSMMAPMSIISSAASFTDDEIFAMERVLDGVTRRSSGTVADWTDAMVQQVIANKCMWDDGQLGANFFAQNGFECEYAQNTLTYNLDDIQTVTQGMLGREFPTTSYINAVSISDDKVTITRSDDIFEGMNITDCVKRGGKIVATGDISLCDTLVSLYDTMHGGYFEAVFEENPSSIYGYTLISFERVSSNQGFAKLIATASSELAEDGTTHSASKAIDNNAKTAWVEGVSGVGVNEWIKLEMSDGSAFKVSSIELVLGYHKSSNHLKMNGRPTELLIECDGYEKKFRTEENHIIIDLGETIKTKSVKITILDAVEGTKFKDTCISEINLIGIDTSTQAERVTGVINDEDLYHSFDEDSDGDVYVDEDYYDEESEDATETGANSSGVVIIIILAIMAVMAVGVVGVVGVILVKKKK